jgi:hypothetical protein
MKQNKYYLDDKSFYVDILNKYVVNILYNEYLVVIEKILLFDRKNIYDH